MRTYFLGLLLLFSFCAQAQDASVKWATQETFFEDLIGKDLPDFKGVKTNNKSFLSTALNDQVVVINFWFEKCPPCIAEMPELDKLVSIYRSKNVRFIGITPDSPITAKRFQNRNVYRYEVVSLTKREISRLNINHGFPSNVLVGRDGKIISAMANISFSEPAFIEKSIAFEEKIKEALLP